MASKIRLLSIQSKVILVFTLLVASAVIIAISGCDPNQQKTKSESGTQDVNRTWHEAPAEQEYTGFLPQNDTDQQQLTESVAETTSDDDSNGASAGEINKKIYDEAKNSVGESSASGPGGGNVACAWFVNKILKRSIGQTVNGDSTSTMGQKFRTMVNAGKAQEIPMSESKPGDIVLSPTEWQPTRNTGHVGIIGEGNQIYSNSSSAKAWSQNFTKQRWQSYYGNNKGLQVKVYRIIA